MVLPPPLLHLEPDLAEPPLHVLEGVGELGDVAEFVDGLQVGLGDVLVEEGFAVRQGGPVAVDQRHHGEQVRHAGEPEGVPVAVDGLHQVLGPVVGSLGIRLARGVPVPGELADLRVVERGDIGEGGERVWRWRPDRLQGAFRPEGVGVDVKGHVVVPDDPVT